MYYSVEEVSKQLNISVVTVYKKLKKINELKEHVKQFNNGKCITEEGIEIIRNSLQVNQFINPLKDELKEEHIKADNTDVLMVYKQLINTLEKQNEQLQQDKEELRQDKLKLYEQLEIKDTQIQNLDQLTRTLKHNQEKLFLITQPQQEDNNIIPETTAPIKAGTFKRILNIFGLDYKAN